MLEEEYKSFVLTAFDHALKHNELSQELVSPTAGNLKAEAVKVCGKRFDPKDVTILSSFFDAEPDADSYLRAIQRRDYQIFRPLSDFLNNRDKGTSFKNIQLLAWLIDFKPRPFSSRLVIPPLPKRTDTVASADNDKTKHEPELGDQPGGSNKKVDKRWLIGGTALLMLALSSWFFLKKSCMYWDDYHYVATSCSIPTADKPLIARDEVRLQEFKRLTRLDTLTYNSVGKLWWVSVDGEIEVYTANGPHPLYPNKKLKKVTEYVVNVCQNRRRKN